jgi:SPP1 gp7 family putative phage head morphogenesis protein
VADQVVARDFGVQFKGAIDNLRGKLPESTLAWDDLAGPVHGKVFAIAGATNTDLVADIQKSLVSALEKGTTITQFRKDFDASVQQYGWTYKGKRGWRTSVIFNNNMRSAHMAGRWEQLLANSDRRPYLQYRTAGDARVRPQHRQWNGLIYPIGDAFWQTHYPPNGWGCRCTIRAYSDADLGNLGIKPSPKFDLKTRAVVSQDGEIKDQVPVGIDPGWDHNVGQSWLAPELALGQKLASLPHYLQGPMVDKTISPAFQKVLSEHFKALRNAYKATKKVVGNAQILGFIDSATVNALADYQPEVSLKSLAVAAFDDTLKHLSGVHKVGKPGALSRRGKGAPQQIWPDEWIDELPMHLRSYRAVMWDIDTGALLIVPQGSFNDTVPVIALKPDRTTALGVCFAITGLGSKDAATLRSGLKFKLLVGSLKK